MDVMTARRTWRKGARGAKGDNVKRFDGKLDRGIKREHRSLTSSAWSTAGVEPKSPPPPPLLEAPPD